MEINEGVMFGIERTCVVLNKEVDKITEEVQSLEERLNRLGVGDQVWSDPVEIDGALFGLSSPNQIEQAKSKLWVGYSRTSKGWGFIVKECVYGFEDERSTGIHEQDHEFAECSRKSRIIASRLIPDVLNKLLDKLEELRGFFYNFKPSDNSY